MLHKIAGQHTAPMICVLAIGFPPHLLEKLIQLWAKPVPSPIASKVQRQARFLIARQTGRIMMPCMYFVLICFAFVNVLLFMELLLTHDMLGPWLGTGVVLVVVRFCIITYNVFQIVRSRIIVAVHLVRLLVVL